MEVTTLDFDHVTVIGELDKQCGEVFLSIEGNLSFLCTLCGMKYKGYQTYADHIIETHHSPSLPEDDESLNSNDQMQLDSQSDESKMISPTILDVSTPLLEDYIEYDSNSSQLDSSADINLTSTSSNFQTSLKVINISENLINTGKEIKKPVLSRRSIAKAREFTCKKCNFVTKARSTIKMHIERHKGLKRHFCQQCNKGFYTLSELRIHTRSHTGERPHHCTECGRSFVAYSTLWRHTKSCKNIRNVECSQCHMKFHNTAALHNHMAVHSEQRSFKCTKCAASFKLQKILKNHMRIHENKHEFKCRYCSVSFNQQSGLLAHEKNKHFELRTFANLMKDS